MTRNQLCPCGSGKKLKKCCGAAAKPQATSAVQPAPGAVEPSVAVSGDPLTSDNPAGLFKHSGRKATAQQADDERMKHLRRRAQAGELRGTLVYNTGSAYRDR
jgi:uncharacterized protein YecA (UPF0149 family)